MARGILGVLLPCLVLATAGRRVTAFWAGAGRRALPDIAPLKFLRRCGGDSQQLQQQQQQQQQQQYRGRTVLRMARDPLIVGLNKYSHDVSCAIVSATTGDLLFMTEKERLVRRKHAAGDAADLVEFALAAIEHELSDVKLVVQQNHHWRIAPFEKRLPWACALDHYPPSYLEDTSLFPHLEEARRHELSHHLAHAWSVFPHAPFQQGLIVVMDGMGEQHTAMARAQRDGDPGFTHDLGLTRHKAFRQVPAILDPLYDYREAESAYYFDGLSLQLVFKRYTRERSPTELYNHGFENMESMGAVYSRLSSHIFGDWNACGKVMGLASYGDAALAAGLPRFMEGDLAGGGEEEEEEEDSFRINWSALEALPRPNEWREADEDKTRSYAQLAFRVQDDLETVALPWIRGLKDLTGATNLCVCGGVAQNSVLNGRITRELGFEQVFIPPYPGDEGISLGCALWGFAAVKAANTDAVSDPSSSNKVKNVPLSRRYTPPLSPYQGKVYSTEEMESEALAAWAPFIIIERKRDVASVVDTTARALAEGKVVAWFQGRSETGPRALGDRSLLADPRRSSMHAFLNGVKKREAFRPFAPSVLAEAVPEWFELGGERAVAVAAAAGASSTVATATAIQSPYMSLTLPVLPARRAEVPAICHVDGSARLQTVREEDNPWYYRLIQAFQKLTGVPMVLNTSFNTLKGEPIVESPWDAVRSFLATAGGIDFLAMGPFVVRRRPFPLDVAEEAAAGIDPALCLVRKTEGVLLEEVVSDTETGIARSVRVARGSEDGSPQWVELAGGELDLVVWQLVDGLSPLADVVEAVLEVLQEDEDREGEEGFEEEDVVAALRRLYHLQLIYFEM